MTRIYVSDDRIGSPSYYTGTSEMDCLEQLASDLSEIGYAIPSQLDYQVIEGE